MIASLMMYLRPETEPAYSRYWAAIRTALSARGIAAPEALSNAAPPFEVWRDPGLVLSQTCGMPYRMRLKDEVALIGTPDFGIEGCPPGYYRSVIVVRTDDPRANLSDFAQARFAYNETGSQSGYAAPYAHTKPLGFWFADRMQSHGHRVSARMIAEGEADIASLDAVTWRDLQRYDDFAKKLRVLAKTEPTPGLPYIAGPKVDAGEVFDAVSEAITRLPDADRDILGIRALVRIPRAAYLAVPSPPSES